MTDQISFTLQKDLVSERSRNVISATFRDRATAAAQTPTNVQYRLDCLTTCTEIASWTSVSSAESVSITITPTQNRIVDNCNRHETKQLTVAADYGLDTQYQETVTYEVRNIHGIS